MRELLSVHDVEGLVIEMAEGYFGHGIPYTDWSLRFDGFVTECLLPHGVFMRSEWTLAHDRIMRAIGVRQPSERPLH